MGPPAKDSASLSIEEVPNSEAQSLLSHEDLEDGIISPSRRSSPNPLPRVQLATIYGIKLVVPVSGQQISPYVNKMIAAMDLPGNGSVGYYTGLLSSVHTAGQILSIFFWGRLSGMLRQTGRALH